VGVASAWALRCGGAGVVVQAHEVSGGSTRWRCTVAAPFPRLAWHRHTVAAPRRQIWRLGTV
jgi:hypothetical protein